MTEKLAATSAVCCRKMNPKRAAVAWLRTEGRYGKNGHFWHENGGYRRMICRQMMRMGAAAIVAE
jgi:hypothetical protein